MIGLTGEVDVRKLMLACMGEFPQYFINKGQWWRRLDGQERPLSRSGVVAGINNSILPSTAFIVAGNYQQSRYYLKKFGIYPSKCKYLIDLNKLRGYRTATLIMAGTYYENKAYRDLHRCAEAFDVVTYWWK